MFLAMVFVLTFTIGCPTEAEDSGASVPTKATAPGFYVGDSVVPVDLSTVTAVNGDDIVSKAFAWLSGHAEEDTVYTIIVGADIDATLAHENTGYDNPGSDNSALEPGWIFLNTHTVNNVKKLTVILKSDATLRTIQLKNKGTLLDMGELEANYNERWSLNGGYWYRADHGNAKPNINLKVVLENIVLKGIDDNNAQLVFVGSGATLDILEGARITGNHNIRSADDTWGAGILILADGLVTLDGGSIDRNIAENNNDVTAGKRAYGGGVCIMQDRAATFIMKSGTIERNEVRSNSSCSGGGILSMMGRYEIHGGTITRNMAVSVGGSPTCAAIGQTYQIVNGAFIYGGSISDNEAVSQLATALVPPGVRVQDNGGDPSFTILVGGNPDISDGLCLFNGNSTIFVDILHPLTNTVPIPIDITNFSLADGDQLIKWAGNTSKPLPVDKFVLGKAWANNTSTPIAGSIGADGKYRAP
jgi:hypothetical protein